METAASNNLPTGCTQVYFDKSPRQPVFLSMKNIQTQLATFKQRWPEEEINATPSEIAKAGVFSLQLRNIVQC